PNRPCCKLPAEPVECVFMILSSDLRYVLLPGEYGGPASASLFYAAFQMWSDVWTAEFEALRVNRRLNSNDFSRQSQIGCLFLQERCVGLVCFHGVDFSRPTARRDSYFEAWRDEAIWKLCRDGRNILVGSHVTVHPEFRGKDVLADGGSV